MLFHVTLTHTEDNCPIYEPERMPSVIQAFEKLEAVGKELGVKQHYFVWCAPDHVAYALVEADSVSAVSRYVFSIPIRQDVQVVPVEHLRDTVASAKKMMEEAKK